jgi:hypothetical protein
MVFRSLRIVKAVVHVGTDRILRAVHEFLRAHKLPVPKPIGRLKVLAIELMVTSSTETPFCPAASPAQLQQFLEA